MNYELAKKLKDAGFPHGTFPYINPDGSDDPRNETPVCQPSLSELIFELGDNSRALVKGSKGFTTDNSEIIGWHCTPEEALAKLWLTTR